MEKYFIFSFVRFSKNELLFFEIIILRLENKPIIKIKNELRIIEKIKFARGQSIVL